METDDVASVRYQFGLFEADARLGLLTKQGKRVALQDLPFRALLLLLDRPGELVTREEMIARLWPKTVVDFDHGLNKAINKIRDVLGDSANSPRFVETVARRGYRFLGDVRRAEAPVAELPPAAIENPEPKRSGRVFLFAAVAVIIALAAVLGINLWRSQAAPQAVKSLAVLPLENLSGDASQEYFADGMTDELITQLAQISELKVISRSSAMAYKNAHKPLAEISRELGVQAVVEGSVMTSGQRVRITAQLIRVPADENIWANSYEGELSETLSLQSEVARAIATQVQVTLSPHEQAALKAQRPVNPQAHEAYLKGRYFWSKRTSTDLKSAVEYFEAALAADPDYAEAYAGLADSYALAGDWEYAIMAPEEAWPKAISAAKRALLLEENLGAAHASLAFGLDIYAWKWRDAETEFKRAIALSPNYATAHHWYAFHLLVMGRDDEAIEELRRAESLDPLSLIIGADIADALCIMHRYDAAIEQSNKVLSMDPNFALAHYELGQALEQKGDHAEAIARFKRAIELSGHSAAFDSNLARAYAGAGQREEALAVLKGLEQQRVEHPGGFANIALAYVGLGDADSAMNWLDKAYAAHENPSILLRPAFDPLRSDVRFKALLSKLGLPEA